mmetsp:Transcript_23007/g.33958  ORF Transcript_23007/g.33958 Transcript_23007/m.33958 type:complete len:92 (-) Transcript_23007:468-743(-)
MIEFEGHEVAVLGTVTGFLGVTNATLGKGWVKSFIHRQPVAAFSVMLCGIGVILPLTVVPIRRALKLPTNQYDAAHPKVTFPKYADVNKYN